MSIKALILLSLSLISMNSCSKAAPKDQTGKLPADTTGTPEVTLKTLLTGYEIIWGMDFLPNGDFIFTEKKGKLYRKSNETVTSISGFPEVLSNSQGGLMDIRIHPDYSNNGWIYSSFTSPNPSGGGVLKLIRFKLVDDKILNIENIYTANGSDTWGGHYGSRIVFDKSNYLYLCIGEGGSGTYGGPKTTNTNAQNVASSWGKVHRMNDDGSVPSDNPVIDGNSVPTTVYSYGHRNPQGLAFHPETGDLWEAEHGPRGGDEINIITKGANYGWPVYSIGVNYDGTKISDGHSATGIKPPLYTFTPSIATCGIAFITSDKFKSWKGNLLVTGLASQKLHRCVVRGNTIVEEEVMLDKYGRVRNVIQAPDGSIYVSVEGPGRIIQIIPE
jgi:glucose/arabinose dehydrogenase